mgnify:FL=1
MNKSLKARIYSIIIKIGDDMTYEDFSKTLKENDLSLKKFSDLSGVKYDTCSKWGKNDRPVSDWVESWLNLHIENEKYKRLKTSLKESGAYEDK